MVNEKLVKEFLRSSVNCTDLLDLINDGVILFEEDRKIRFANKQALKLLGYKEGDIIEEKCREVIRGSHCATGCPLRKFIETGIEEQNVKMNYTTKDGRSLEVSTSFMVFKDDAGNHLAYAEIFKDVTEISVLKREIKEAPGFDQIIGQNSKMQEIYQLITEVAPTDATVLITGESGTGKELIARAIHNFSRRKENMFVKVNCAALAEGVLESELFGHVRGAFTGALVERKGRFELANNGTIFLDEIGDLGPMVQVKLLRILQEGEYEMVGSTQTKHANIRAVAATNRDLLKLIKEEQFREDLYYRLKVVPINVPSLRERRDDIPLLVKHFLKRNNSRMDRNIRNVSKEVLNLLMVHPLPGNVRELENIIEHAFVRCQDDTIELGHLPRDFYVKEELVESKDNGGANPLRMAERDTIIGILERCGWNIQTALKILGVSRATLWRKMKEHNIRKPN
ncbi:sigma-54 interaction domain-containing protein [Acidobacteriota bacterium]